MVFVNVYIGLGEKTSVIYIYNYDKKKIKSIRKDIKYKACINLTNKT